ncbi:MAG: hypothetical protein AB8H80_19910 [Planctomycetota bacterium]
MERTGWTLTILLSLGAAMLVLALLPGAWPNPLEQGASGGAAADSGQARLQLGGSVAAVEDACQRGDGAAFAQWTTADYRVGVERRLAAVDGSAIDGQLDAATLREMGGRAGNRLPQWLERDYEAMHVKGPYVGISVRRDPAANGRSDGAQILVFYWDGKRFLLDEVRHAPRVGDAQTAGRYLRELLRLR